MGVYFIKGGQLIKIGYTTDLEQRLASLQIASPAVLTVVHWDPEGTREDERSYHDQLAAHRRQGEWFAAKPVLDLLKIHTPRKKARQPKILSAQDVQRLMVRAGDSKGYRGPRDVLCLKLLYHCGLRISEAVSIAPWQIDYQTCTIKILESKSGEGTAYFQREDLVPYLERWLTERSTFGLHETDPLICHRSGRAVSTRYYQRLFERLGREFKIRTQCTPHVLRHTFATERLGEGFSVPQVQRLLRHANQATTEQYLHILDSELQQKMQEKPRYYFPNQHDFLDRERFEEGLRQTSRPEPTLSDLMAKLAEMEVKLNERS